MRSLWYKKKPAPYCCNPFSGNGSGPLNYSSCDSCLSKQTGLMNAAVYFFIQWHHRYRHCFLEKSYFLVPICLMLCIGGYLPRSRSYVLYKSSGWRILSNCDDSSNTHIFSFQILACSCINHKGSGDLVTRRRSFGRWLDCLPFHWISREKGAIKYGEAGIQWKCQTPLNFTLSTGIDA